MLNKKFCSRLPAALSFARNCLRSAESKRACFCSRLPAALDGDGTGDRGDDGCKEFKDFSNVGPVYFDHNFRKFYEH